MKSAPSCIKCSTPLPVEHLNSGELLPCPSCATPFRVEVFPAFFREAAKGASGEALLIDSEASCFYHAQKRAAVVCSTCGRFLCALCDVELDGAHYCPGCLEAGKDQGKIAAIDNTRHLYDTLALQLAILGLVIFYFSPFTAPMAIYFAWKHRRAPSSIIRNPSKWRWILAIILGVLQLLGWLALVGFLLTR